MSRQWLSSPVPWTSLHWPNVAPILASAYVTTSSTGIDEGHAQETVGAYRFLSPYFSIDIWIESIAPALRTL
jgi:hypothetical protein